MCDFAVDLTELRATYGEMVADLDPDIEKIMDRFGTVIQRHEDGFQITEHARHVARLIARCFDTYDIASAIYSRAS